MERPAARIPLNGEQWRRVNDLAERLEQAWGQAETVALGSFLPPAEDPLRAAALRELVKTDLEIRWRRGQLMTLERYLEEFPELAASPETLTELLHEEFRVRKRHGDQLPLSSYQERFPALYAELCRQAQEHPLPTLAGPAPTPAESLAPFASGPAMESNHLLPIGGGYVLESLIGRGGFGEVWRARAPGGVLVAVKIIRRPADHEERLREERALEVVKQLRHHFLAKTNEYHSDKENLFIVMELADCSLRDRLREARKAGREGLPAEALVLLFREAAEALDYLHAKGALHRDIKPDNILLVEGHVRVADFGLARLKEQQMVSVSGSGTYAYMAPEVWGGKASAASDQYSLAYSYAEMRLGRRPFTHTDFASLMFDHMQRTPDLEPMSEAEKQIVLQALAKSPDNRFPTCVDFARALERLAGGGGNAPTHTPLASAGTGRGTQQPPPQGTRIGFAPLSEGASSAESGEVRTSRLSSAPAEDDDAGTEALASLVPPRAARPRSADAPIADTAHTARVRPTASPTARLRRPPRPWKGFVAFLAVVALAVAAFVAWLVFTPPSPPHPDPAASFTLTPPPALVLRAGASPRTVQVGLERKNFNDAVELTITAPPHVTVRNATIPPGADGVAVELSADRDAEKGESKIRIHGAAGNLGGDVELSLTIRGPVFLPAGFKPLGEAVAEDDAGREEFYPAIVTDTPGVPATEFVLLRPQAPDDPPPFYAMKTKASNELVASLRSAAGQPAWTFDAAKGRLPAFGLTAADAGALAHALGGLLPTTKQWDRAASFAHREGRDGPAHGPRVAVGLIDKDPLPVDDADSDDVTAEGVRDLAGNGTEFTRGRTTEQKTPGSAAVPRTLVVLRGWRYTKLKPMTYADLESQQKAPQVQFESKGSPYTTFRMVIEPPAP